MSYQNQAGSKERGRTTESGEPLKIGALWRRRSRKGVEYWAGIINEQRVIVFKVREKRSDKSPDYEVFKSDRPAAEGRADSAF